MVDGWSLVVVVSCFRLVGLGELVSVLSSEIMCLMIWMELGFLVDLLVVLDNWIFLLVWFE